ncbi:MAG: GNAT family N-acetyltransferase [Lysobacteraceae bacterium]
MVEFRTHTSLSEIPAAQLDALHDGRNPFLAHAFLSGLEVHGCLRPNWGWEPLHATLWDGDALIAAAPGYLKGNSHGEFVFDHQWAAAIERAGRDYYPKWLFAIPYTPVTGPRFLARDDAARAMLLSAILESAQRLKLSSLHANFLTDFENAACPSNWLKRSDVQFHWQNDSDWKSFDAFLAALQSKKRKNIRQERAQVREAGITFRVVHGDEATHADIADMHALYLRAFAGKGNSASLTLAFFQHLAGTMPRALVLVLAQLNGETIAGALCLRGGDTLYGRYWGCFVEVPGLHFETCYYQGIEYCLREGLHRFEPGAQGEHKIARGFLPVTMHSRHHFTEDGIDGAFARWCDEERIAVDHYRRAVLAHSPYRDSGST